MQSNDPQRKDYPRIIQELEQSPEILLEEFLDFILFTKQRRQAHPTPIWEVAARLTKDIPTEILQQLPTDGATEHDHYLYEPLISQFK